MTEMTPSQRRMQLHRLLAQGRKVVASRLAKNWGCVARTLRRDLQKMRDVEGLPIAHDPIDQTWRYTQPVAEIPPILVTTEDRRALLFALQAAAQFDNTPVSPQIRRLCQNLLSTLPPEGATRFTEMMASVRFTGQRTFPINPPVWDVLLLCLEAHETLQMTYTDGVAGCTTRREVDPYGLVMRDRRWILVGFRHLRQQVQTFALQRIAEAQSSDTVFQSSPQFMDDYLANGFDGMQSTGAMRKIVLRIDKGAPPFVQDRLWSEGESRRRDAQGHAVVEFQTAALFAVEREVRAEGGWVELLEPAESRRNLREMGQALAAAHR